MENLFNFNGHDSLIVYCVSLGLVLAFAILWRGWDWWQQTQITLPEHIVLSPWQTAYLRGGCIAVTQTALFDLNSRGLIAAELTSGIFRGVPNKTVTNLHPISNALWYAAQMSGGLAPRRAGQHIRFECQKLELSLEHWNLIRNRSQRLFNHWPLLLAFGLVLGGGLIKLVVGISRDKPVGFLLLLLLLTMLLMFFCCYSRRLTSAGRRWLEQETARMLKKGRAKGVGVEAATPFTSPESKPLPVSKEPAYLDYPAVQFAVLGWSMMGIDQHFTAESRKLVEHCELGRQSNDGAGCGGGCGGGGGDAGGCGGGGCGGGCGGCGS